jgi:hypothetical protein
MLKKYESLKRNVSKNLPLQKVLFEYKEMDFQSMMIQDLQRSATVIDHQHLEGDHSKACHEQYPEAKTGSQKMRMSEG